MQKKILSLAMAVTLLVGASFSVQAEDYQGEDGWKVTFDGKKMENSFTSSDIDSAIYDILPGDSIEIHLDLQNTSKKDADWYMTNEVLQSLEDSKNVAEGGVYTYVLTYVDPQGEARLLYSSDSVDGENIQKATDALEDYFFLDSIEAGKSGEIVLKVGLEGETQGNDYQNALVRMQMNFAVEPTVEGSHTTIKEQIIETIKTGDNARVMVFVGVTLIAGLTCLIIAIMKMRRNDDNQDGTGKESR